MKVTVVGSGSMWSISNSASYIIDDKIVVDYPNGMNKNLLKIGIDPKNINNILITHFHGDHYFDIPFYLLFKSRAEDKKINIYSGKEGKTKISKILKLAFPNSAKNMLNEIELKYNFNDKFNIEDYSIDRLLVDHGRMKPSYGYIVSKDNIKIGFTGDSTVCKNVEYMARTCSYVFCDCSFIEGTTKHMGVDMIKALASKYNCIFVTSHMDDKTREELKNLNIKNIIVPEDGTIINI